MMAQLSQHFTLAEFIASDTAQRRRIDNNPPQNVIDELKRTAALMELVRTALTVPITITSGYRCSALNKMIGSSPTSKHVQGLACDFKAPAYGDPMAVCEAIERSGIVFGKLILEFYTPDGGGWTHIQVGTERKVLTINPSGTFAGLKP
jgi:hypothetical protein